MVVMIIFVGALIPVMLFYNIYQYVVFRGKVTAGSYGE
jgi:cytochrome d ubiquinol oxidase subunit II